ATHLNGRGVTVDTATTLTADQIKTILADHGKWYRGEAGGKRAYLRSAYLRSADLGGANLGGADLSGAYLGGADLRSAYLGGANLRSANLRSANLGGADLSGAYLSGANLGGANLGGAYLGGADLRSANLSGANLRSAYLGGADLGDEQQQRQLLAHQQIVPETGAFEGWKKLRDGHIARIVIPEAAGRVGGLIGRKCRAEEAIVVAIYNQAGDQVEGPVASQYDPNFFYKHAEIVIPESWDPDPRLECSSGIHFFLTRLEAEQY